MSLIWDLNCIHHLSMYNMSVSSGSIFCVTVTFCYTMIKIFYISSYYFFGCYRKDRKQKPRRWSTLQDYEIKQWTEKDKNLLQGQCKIEKTMSQLGQLILPSFDFFVFLVGWEVCKISSYCVNDLNRPGIELLKPAHRRKRSMKSSWKSL